jgi:hypothetical protein
VVLVVFVPVFELELFDPEPVFEVDVPPDFLDELEPPDPPELRWEPVEAAGCAFGASATITSRGVLSGFASPDPASEPISAPNPSVPSTAAAADWLLGIHELKACNENLPAGGAAARAVGTSRPCSYTAPTSPVTQAGKAPRRAPHSMQ